MTDVATKHPGGRPPFEPTEEQRRDVRDYALLGVPQDEIADYIGIDPTTLRTHFRAELSGSVLKILAQVARNVVRHALGAPAVYDKGPCDNCGHIHGGIGALLREEIKPQAWAMCFLLKTRGKKWGWTERIEHTGRDGGAIQVQFDFSQLTDDELDTVERARLILARIAPAGYLDGDQPTAH